MSDDIKWDIKPDDVEWEMDWGDHHETPQVRKTGKEMMFEKEIALAHLLLNEVVFINSNWWMYFETDIKDHKWALKPRSDARWTEEESKTISVNVICNDVFAWGCSESETLPHDEIKNLYRMWKKDSQWGPAVWCMIQRGQMPQKPVEDAIRKAGIWNLDELMLSPQGQPTSAINDD